jgi:hypothetical protein
VKVFPAETTIIHAIRVSGNPNGEAIVFLVLETHAKFMLSNRLYFQAGRLTKCKSLDGFPVIGHSSLRTPTFVVYRIDLNKYMKKYIWILAGAALLVACKQRIETAAPSPTVSPEATAATSPEESDTSTNPSPAATP